MKTLADRLVAQRDAIRTTVRTVRRHLHQHPEPSGEEFETTRYIANHLAVAGIRHRLIPSRRGILAEGIATSGPTLLLRADMDALRMDDRKDVSYRSRRANVMHSCGHDAHTAMALGAVLALCRVEAGGPLPFRWRAIFQPAEETATGATEMMEAGALEQADAILALHMDPSLETGSIGLREGVLTAWCDVWQAEIVGAGGHGARPHLTRDPIRAAGQLLTHLDQTVARPGEAGVFSVGMVHGGTAPNVIPDRCVVEGSLRAYDGETLAAMRGRLQAGCTEVAQRTQTDIQFATEQSMPGVVNDPTIVRACRGVLADRYAVVEISEPSYGGEDFAFYLRDVRGCLLRLGCRKPGAEPRHLHSSLFDIDEDALDVGVEALLRALLAISETLSEQRLEEPGRKTDY